MNADQLTAVLAGAGVPIRRRDRLVVQFTNVKAASTVQFGGRILRRDGVVVDVNEQHPLIVSGGRQTFEINLVDGWLLSFQINAVESFFRPGTMYVESFLAFGTGKSTERYRTLIAGYLDPYSALDWPDVFRVRPGEGQGAIRAIFWPTPAAGAEIDSGALPAGKHKIMALGFRFTTDATVANRTISMQIWEPSGGVIAQILAAGTQAASITRQYTFTIGINDTAAAAPQVSEAKMPDIMLTGTCELHTVTNGLQAGDRFTQVVGMEQFWAAVPDA